VFACLAGAFSVPAAQAIVTGSTAVRAGDLPFVAQVTVGGGSCTGSLIAPRWVLTAEHCSNPSSLEGISVRVGNNTRNSGGELRSVSRILRSPTYQGGHDDVALLELSTAITDITPVQLATPDRRPSWDGIKACQFCAADYGIAVGWGQNETGALPSQLQRLQVTITPPNTTYPCRTAGDQGCDALGIKMIETSKGACPGDSGGPLLLAPGLNWYIQYGVTKGVGCGTSANYSEVGYGPNRDWILRMIAPEDPLLAAVGAPPDGDYCAPYDTTATAVSSQSDRERYGINCLINEVRGNAGLKPLSFCAFSGTFCQNSIPGATLNFAQMSGFNIAAEYRSQDMLGWNSGTSLNGLGIEHGACGRAAQLFSLPRRALEPVPALVRARLAPCCQRGDLGDGRLPVGARRGRPVAEEPA
jgi:secreted trypsin-like serine protease